MALRKIANFFSRRDRLDFSSDLNETAKIRTASFFFDNFGPSEDQKRHFMKHPIQDSINSGQQYRNNVCWEKTFQGFLGKDEKLIWSKKSSVSGIGSLSLSILSVLHFWAKIRWITLKTPKLSDFDEDFRTFRVFLGPLHIAPHQSIIMVNTMKIQDEKIRQI